MPYNDLIHTRTPMTLEELFEYVTEVIARPETEITEEHKKKAVLIFTYFDEFMTDNDPEYYEKAGWHPEIDLTAYATKILDELEGKK
jgi:hypothetical protein